MGQGWALTLTARVSLCLGFNSKEFSCYSGEWHWGVMLSCLCYTVLTIVQMVDVI